jgi:hypothetical protein
MSKLEKPKSITVTVSDRKEGKYRSFVVYDSTVEEVENKVKKALED